MCVWLCNVYVRVFVSVHECTIVFIIYVSMCMRVHMCVCMCVHVVKGRVCVVYERAYGCRACLLASVCVCTRMLVTNIYVLQGCDQTFKYR